jgi:hypothetical protein
MLGLSFTGANMSEHAIQNAGRNALAQPGIFNTRANVGRGWTGDVTKLPDGSILIRNPRPFDTGLPDGFTDTFGVTSETVTPEWCARMMGKTIGLAHFIEYKSLTGRVRPAQARFIEAMRRLGARAGIARSADQAVAIALGTAA